MFARVSLWISGALALLGTLVVLGSVISNSNTPGPLYLALINVNLIFAILLVGYIGRQAVLAFLERRGQLAGSRLQIRFLGIFSILAVLPAIVVSVFALVMLNRGVEFWFSNKVEEVINGSLRVTNAYMDEHKGRLEGEAKVLANDSAMNAPRFMIDPKALREKASIYQLDEISIYDRAGLLMAYAGDLPMPAPLDAEVADFLRNNIGETKVFQDFGDNRMVAVTPMNEGRQLVIARWVHPSVQSHINHTKASATAYQNLQHDKDRIRIIFNMFLIVLALSTLAVAVWVGLRLAARIIKPVTELVHATNRVSSGDLDVRVTPKDDDEIGILTQSFNRMTLQLRESKKLLEKKNREMDSRRKTSDAVLTGVTAGVMGVNSEGIITFSNQRAIEVIGANVGDSFTNLDDELKGTFDSFNNSLKSSEQRQIKVKQGDDNRILLVKFAAQRLAGGKLNSLIVTFDDITDLLSVQRVAAWSDVARRLAHEVKNPLTPIQLSAERLRRKYLKQINDDKELFEQLTETIVSQAEQMRNMMNEFSDFARMPSAKFAEDDLVSIIDEILVLQRMGRGDINFVTEYDVNPAKLICDRAQLNRVITNTIENAVNAIQENPLSEKEALKYKGQIKVVVKMSQGDTLSVSVEDNGCGLPEDVDVDTLFDPYVTTRKKGTGLGLAIVRRVVDEHEGTIRLIRRKQGGTCVEMTFPTTLEKTKLA